MEIVPALADCHSLVLAFERIRVVGVLRGTAIQSVGKTTFDQGVDTMLQTSQVSQPVAAKDANYHLHSWKLLMASLILLLCSNSGCSIVHNAHRALSYNDSWNEAVVVMRNRNWSAKAWHKRKHHFCNERYADDFCAGFRQGYEDVANGSNGCTPATPPRQYWSWEHQSAEGQSQMGAWFSGYPQGARAAEEDGVGNWTQLQLSSGLQSQFQKSGMLPSGPITYPIQETTVGRTPMPVGTGSMTPIPMGEPTRVPMP